MQRLTTFTLCDGDYRQYTYINGYLYIHNDDKVSVVDPFGKTHHLDVNVSRYSYTRAYQDKLLINKADGSYCLVSHDGVVATIITINFQLSPYLCLDVLNGTLFLVSNPSSGNNFYIPVTLVYDSQVGTYHLNKSRKRFSRLKVIEKEDRLEPLTLVDISNGEAFYIDTYDYEHYNVHEDILITISGKCLSIRRLIGAASNRPYFQWNIDQGLCFNIDDNFRLITCQEEIVELMKYRSRVYYDQGVCHITPMTQHENGKEVRLDIYRLKWRPVYHRYQPRSRRENIRYLFFLHQGSILTCLSRDLIYIIANYITS